jgi:hypothetical protein
VNIYNVIWEIPVIMFGRLTMKAREWLIGLIVVVVIDSLAEMWCSQQGYVSKAEGENMEKVTKEKQLTVVIQNTVGTLAEVTSVVADKGLNIENVCAYTAGDVAVFHIMTNDNEKARKALEKEGYRVVETEAIVVQLWNRPGSLSAVATKFRQHAINLQYVYGTSSLAGEKMTIVFSSENNDKAMEVFDSMVIEEADKTV